MNSAVKSLFTKYLSHLTGYVVAAATAVTAVDPALLPPLGKLAVGVAGLVVFAANHAYQAGTGVAIAQAAVNATTKALSAVATPVALILTLAIGLPLLQGCAQLTAFEASPTGAEVIAASVGIAVATAEAKGFSAARINAIAKTALAADSGSTATLAAVSAVVQSELATLKLPAADQAVVDVLVAALSGAIQAKVGNNATLAQAQAVAAVVIQDVIAATGG